MNRLALALAVPAIAIGALSFVDDAAARGMRFGGGGPMFARTWSHQAVHSPRWKRNEARRVDRHIVRRKYARPVLIERDEPVVKKAIVAERIAPVTRIRAAAPAIKYVDEDGRQYDLKSRTWFDGESTCFSGKYGWAYKGGDWYYGAAKWEERKDGWSARGPNQPETVDCLDVPVFAAKVKPAEGGAKKVAADKPAQGGRQVPTSAETEETDKPAIAKANDRTERREVARSTTSGRSERSVSTTVGKLCEKYFPAIGQMLSVPCN